MVLAEAIAAGLPIVASTSGAIPEVLGEQATYFAPGDWVGLARALADQFSPDHLDSGLPTIRESPRRTRAQLRQNGWPRPMRRFSDGELREEEPLRILFTVHHSLDPNTGAPGATLNLGRALEGLGHHVEYFSFENLPRWLPPRARELLFPEVTAFALRRAVDVIDAMTGDAWLFALRTRKPSARRPLLVTRAHGIEHVFHEARVAEAHANGTALPLLARLYHGGLRLREVAESLRRADLALFLNDDDLTFAVNDSAYLVSEPPVPATGSPMCFLGLPLEPAGPEIGIAFIGTYHERKGIRYGVPALRGTSNGTRRFGSASSEPACPPSGSCTTFRRAYGTGSSRPVVREQRIAGPTRALPHPAFPDACGRRAPCPPRGNGVRPGSSHDEDRADRWRRLSRVATPSSSRRPMPMRSKRHSTG